MGVCVCGMTGLCVCRYWGINVEGEMGVCVWRDDRCVEGETGVVCVWRERCSLPLCGCVYFCMY